MADSDLIALRNRVLANQRKVLAKQRRQSKSHGVDFSAPNIAKLVPLFDASKVNVNTRVALLKKEQQQLKFLSRKTQIYVDARNRLVDPKLARQLSYWGARRDRVLKAMYSDVPSRLGDEMSREFTYYTGSGNAANSKGIRFNPTVYKTPYRMGSAEHMKRLIDLMRNTVRDPSGRFVRDVERKVDVLSKRVDPTAHELAAALKDLTPKQMVALESRHSFQDLFSAVNSDGPESDTTVYRKNVTALHSMIESVK